jgi:hypothetical protein
MPIIYRLTKGSPLTHEELDGNFQFLTGSVNAISGTYAKTGSNTFNGNQTIYGSLNISGSTTINSVSGARIFPTSSGVPTFSGSDGQFIFGSNGGNQFIYVWMASRWRSGSLS